MAASRAMSAGEMRSCVARIAITSVSMSEDDVIALP
jgi:hypothetical protein